MVLPQSFMSKRGLDRETAAILAGQPDSIEPRSEVNYFAVSHSRSHVVASAEISVPVP